jgi:hypothetical protein
MWQHVETAAGSSTSIKSNDNVQEVVMVREKFRSQYLDSPFGKQEQAICKGHSPSHSVLGYGGRT